VRGAAAVSRRQEILAGIVALRGSGAARKGEATDGERGALFDLAGLEDRLSGFADDQSEDDWGDFWIAPTDVETLRRHVAALVVAPRGIATTTIASLTALAAALDEIVQPAE
jgi:hypothetical protein